MNYYDDKEKAAVEALTEALALPVPSDCDDVGCRGFFDPWSIFPGFYGTYSSEFDAMALTVLRDMRDRSWIGDTLAHDMFREFLCVVGLCDYGSSPRACFPSEGFRPLLPELVDKWERYSDVQWSEPPTP